MVNITGFTYNNNGDKMFATGDNKLIYEFDLPVNFDDASINYNNVFYDRTNDLSSLTGTQNRCVDINSDETRMYVADNGNRIHQYNLSTGSDLSTIDYEVNYLNQERSDGYMTEDGLKFFTLSYDRRTLKQYSLSVPYKIKSATEVYSRNMPYIIRVVRSGGTRIQYSYPAAFTFSNDGKKLYIINPYLSYEGVSGGKLTQYNLRNSFDISIITAEYSVNHFLYSVPNSRNSNGSFSYFIPRVGTVQIKVNPDNDKLYILNEFYGRLYEFSMPDGDITNLPELYDYNASKSMQFTYVDINGITRPKPDLYGLHFKPDGLSFFVSDLSGNIFEYTKSGTAWEISGFSLANTTANVPRLGVVVGLPFANNGTKLYLVNSSGIPALGNIYEMNLDSPYAISTISDAYTEKSLSVSSYESNITGIAINSDNTRLFIVGQGSDKVHEFTLSDPGEIYSASYVGFFDISPQTTLPTSIEVSSDDSKFFVTSSNTIYQYSLGADSIGSSLYDDVSYLEVGLVTTIDGLRFENNGNYFHLAGLSGTKRGIDRYSTETNFQVVPL